MESSASKQDLLELLLLLAHLTAIQLKALCQFVQITPDSQAEENILALQPILSKASEDQIQRLTELATQSEDNEGDDEDAPPSKEETQLSKEMNLSAAKMRTVVSSMTLLLSLQQLEDLLQNLSVAQLMKMFEVLPQGPPVQQLQLLQQIQQLFGQLQPQVLLTLHSQMESASPGTEHSVLSSLLNLPAEYFQLYQPLRLLLQLDSTELASLQNVLPNLLASQILQLLQLLQLQPFDVLELRSLFHPNESQSDFMSIGVEDGVRPSGDGGSDPSSGSQKEIGLNIVDQPPEKSVYKRNLKPNPMVLLTGDPKLNDGNLYVAPLLIRCDSFTEEPKFLTGNRPVRVTNGRVVTFRKLKINTTSHQQQETLFCIKFELRRYTGDEIYEVLDAVHSNPINVLSHSTQMKPVPTLSPSVQEVIPNKGPVGGGTRVAIIGGSFVDSPSARIRFDSVDVMPVFHGGGTLICHTPQHQEGTVEVKVCNSAKKWSETVATFTYDSKCSSFVPPSDFASNFPMTDGQSSHGNIQGSIFRMGDGAMRDVENFAKSGGNLQDQDERSFTALHYASSNGNSQIVDRLLQLGAVADFPDRIGRNAMHFAAMEDQVDVVSRLLTFGCDPCRQSQIFGSTPLIDAIGMGSMSSAHILIEDARSVNVPDVASTSPLHVAILAQDLNLVQHLCTRGAFVNFQDEDGETPLHYAVRSGNLGIVKTLLDFSASTRIQDEDGDSPLDFAVEFQENSIFQLLLHYQQYFQLEDQVEEEVEEEEYEDALSLFQSKFLEEPVYTFPRKLSLAPMGNPFGTDFNLKEVYVGKSRAVAMECF